MPELLTAGWPLVLALYSAMSVLAFGLYGYDKWRAANGGWRLSERSLHLCALLGGFVGALLAQQVFRHKRRKSSFMLIFWLIVLLHAAGWATWAWWRLAR